LFYFICKNFIKQLNAMNGFSALRTAHDMPFQHAIFEWAIMGMQQNFLDASCIGARNSVSSKPIVFVHKFQRQDDLMLV